MQGKKNPKEKKEKKEKSAEVVLNERISQAIDAGNMGLFDKLIKELDKEFPSQGVFKEDGEGNIRKKEAILRANLTKAIAKFASVTDLASAHTALIIAEKLSVLHKNLHHLHNTQSFQISGDFIFGRALFLTIANDTDPDAILKISQLIATTSCSNAEKINALCQCLDISLSEYNPSKSPEQLNALYEKINHLVMVINGLDATRLLDSQLNKVPLPPPGYAKSDLSTLLLPSNPQATATIKASFTQKRTALSSGGTASASQKGSTPAKDVKKTPGQKYSFFPFFHKNKQAIPIMPDYPLGQIPNDKWKKAVQEMQNQVSVGSTSFRSAYSTLLAGIKPDKPPTVAFYEAHQKYVNSLLKQALNNFEHTIDIDPVSTKKKVDLYQTVFNLVQCLIEIDQGYRQFHKKNMTDILFPKELIERLGFYEPKLKGSQECPMMKFCTLCYYKDQYEKLIVPLRAQGHKILPATDNGFTRTYKGEQLSEKTQVERSHIARTYNLTLEKLTPEIYVSTGEQDSAIKAYNERLQEKALVPQTKAVIGHLDSTLNYSSTGKLSEIFPTIGDYIIEDEDDKAPVNPSQSKR